MIRSLLAVPLLAFALAFVTCLSLSTTLAGCQN